MAAPGYDFRTIEVEKEEDGVAWLWFNTPEKRNAITPDLSREMNICLDQLKNDDDVRVVILTGRGTAFCAGMDLKVFYQFRDRPAREWAPEGFSSVDWFEKFRVFPKPTIAAVNGHAYGGGVMPIAYADVAIVSDRVQIGLSEINWGSPPGGGATRSVLEVMPIKWAKWMALSGQVFDGELAVLSGLANWVVPHEKLLDEARRIARIFLPHHPVALAYGKKQILESLEIIDHDKAVHFEQAFLGEMRRVQGYTGGQTGWKAFADKEYRPGLQALDFRKTGAAGERTEEESKEKR